MAQRLLLAGVLALVLGASASTATGQHYRVNRYQAPVCYPPVIYVPVCPAPWQIVPQVPVYPPPRVMPETTTPNTGPGMARPEPAKPDPGKSATVPEPRLPDPGTSRDGPGGIKPATFDLKKPPSSQPESFELPKPKPPVPELPSPGGSDIPRIDPGSIPLIAPPRPADPDANNSSPVKPDGVSPPTIPLLPPPKNLKDADAPKLPPLRSVPDPSLPGLSIPVPGGDKEKSTSKASPLAALPRPLIDVIPVSGMAPADPMARRRVNFFNHTDRDLMLVVEGQPVTLPRRHRIAASVPPTFVWQMDGEAEQRTVIPTAVPGVEVVIRR